MKQKQMIITTTKAIRRLSLLLCLVLTRTKIVLTSANISEHNEEVACRVYLAPSTIPNAGFGIFAGINFQPEDVIISNGDIAVPLDDLSFHTGSALPYNVDRSWHNIWADYTWIASPSIAEGIDFDYQGYKNKPGQSVETIELASFGIGALPNCKFPFVNIHSNPSMADTAGLDRNSPGNGAFTPYNGREWFASESIAAGSEIFIYYGRDYFENRPYLAHVPNDRDYQKADAVTKKLGKVRMHLGEETPEIYSYMMDLYGTAKMICGGRGHVNYEKIKNASFGIGEGLGFTNSRLEMLVVELFDDIERLCRGNPRVGNALPSVQEIIERKENLSRLMLKGPRAFEKKHNLRDMSRLKDNGECIDGLRSGVSTIPHSGRGAFATRHFQKGSKIAPVPLIHIGDRAIFNMYNGTESNPKQRDLSTCVHKALMLNYCFGHKDSTMLLSPYGSATSLINHAGGEGANARMVWADEWMSHPEWLYMSVETLKKKQYTGLAWNLIALRNIGPNEEIFIDYGTEWEEAWNEHTKKWQKLNNQHTGTFKPYIPARELNENIEHVLLGAIANRTEYAYMGHGVILYCYTPGTTSSRPADNYFQMKANFFSQACRPIALHQGPTGERLFTAEIIEMQQYQSIEQDWNYSMFQVQVKMILFGVPHSIFHFEELSYTMAHRMSWSFRHEMIIPDDLFPEAWKNL